MMLHRCFNLSLLANRQNFHLLQGYRLERAFCEGLGCFYFDYYCCSCYYLFVVIAIDSKLLLQGSGSLLSVSWIRKDSLPLWSRFYYNRVLWREDRRLGLLDKWYRWHWRSAISKSQLSCPKSKTQEMIRLSRHFYEFICCIVGGFGLPDPW